MHRAVLQGGRGSSAVERATPGEEVPGLIPVVAARAKIWSQLIFLTLNRF